MSFTAWLRPSARRDKDGNAPPGTGGAGYRFRPALEPLEDRWMPSVSTFASYLFPGATTNFQVIVPRTTNAGDSADIAVIAVDAANHPNFNYTGTVSFSSSDTAAILPGDYTFTKKDMGFKVFRATVGTTGSNTFTVTDTSDPSITGSASSLDSAPVATHFALIGTSQTATGIQKTFGVVALDASNHVVTDYAGTVRLTTSDGTATVSSDYTFTPSDRGYHNFQATFNSAGVHTLRATDVGDSNVTGAMSLTITPPQQATQLMVLTRPGVVPGRSFAAGVVALDASNRVVENYTGTIRLTSSAAGAALPADYTFTADDHGYRQFNLTLPRTGDFSISVMDNSSTPLMASTTVNVTPLASLGDVPMGDVAALLATLFKRR